MMICVECAAPVQFLYTYYSEDNIHATKCSSCGNFADKYIECDKVLIVIDLLLLRKAAVRHVVFNAAKNHAMQIFPSSLQSVNTATIKNSDEIGRRALQSNTKNAGLQDANQGEAEPVYIGGVSSTVFRLLIFVTLFDVYLQWAMSERSTVPSILHFLVVTHPAIQYALFMTLCICDTLLVHITIRWLTRYFLGWTDGAAVSTSLLIGSFFKLLPILTLIWHYDIPYSEQLVQYFSLVCTTEVLSITLGCKYILAGIFTFIGRGASILMYNIFWSLV